MRARFMLGAGDLMRLRSLIAATALLATQPAAAGITAHYRMGYGPEQRLMVIEVNDRGDGRADIGGGAGILLLLGGTFYVVDTDAEGAYAARAEDAFAVGMEEWEAAEGPPDRDPAAPVMPLPPDPPPPPPPQVEVTRGGTETVAGRAGTVWRVRDPAAPAATRDEEFVVSADAELAPLNALLGPREPAGSDPMFDPNGAFAARVAVYRQGAILREGRTLRLERVEIHAMPGAFTLPGPVLDREALAARRRRAGR